MSSDQRRPTFFIKTFGCQMNRDDSTDVATLLRGLGMSEASSAAEADLVHVNTCCVRQKAEDKFFSYLGVQRIRKERKGDVVIGVSGCIPEKQDLRGGYAFIDYVTGAKSTAVYQSQIADVVHAKFPDLNGSPGHAAISPISAFHTVMRGCSNYCTYCIVPYVRGPEISSEPKKLCDEIRAKVEAGTKEITLLGQNVLAYGYDLKPRKTLLDVMELICDLPGLERVRFVTSHPGWVTEEFVAGITKLPEVCEHFHVPFQSGDDGMLKRMNRGYSVGEYVDMIEMIRGYYPKAGITADVIVGFTDETRAEFENTLGLIEKIRIDNIYSFKYSPRPKSRASAWEDNVPLDEKKKRLAELNELEDGISREINEGLIGKEQEVMVVDAVGDGKRRYRGRTRTSKLTDFTTSRELEAGEIARVSITGATPHGLQGEARER